MFLVVFTLFSFLLMNIVKAALITNFKLLQAFKQRRVISHSAVIHGSALTLAGRR